MTGGWGGVGVRVDARARWAVEGVWEGPGLVWMSGVVFAAFAGDRP